MLCCVVCVLLGYIIDCLSYRRTFDDGGMRSYRDAAGDADTGRLVRSFVRSLADSFVRSLAGLLVGSFVRSFVH